MKAPKCKICGHEHYGLCPHVVAEKLVDALLPPAKPRAKPKVERKPQLQVIEGSPAEKLAKAREIIKEIEAKPTRRKANASPAKATKAKPAKPLPSARPEGVASRPRRAAAPAKPQPAVLSPADPPRSEAANREAAESPAGAAPKPARKGNRHSPGYMAEYMRKRRAAKKEQPK